MKPFLIFCLVFSLHNNVFSCSCAAPPKTFVSTISEFTAELEVVAIDTIRTVHSTKFWHVVLTKLKVVRSFNDSVTVDYVWMNNASGTDCQRGLFPDSIGQKYIITGRLFEDKRFNQWTEEGRTFLYVSSCGKAVLDVEDNKVYGVITKNNDKEIRQKYERLMKDDEAKAKAYYEEVYRTKHHQDLVQTMALSEFYTLMKRLN